jgi:hypothetical protein
VGIRRRNPTLAALATCFLLCGCGLLRTTSELPGRVASAALGTGGKAPPVDPNVVQTRFMRFADIFANEINQATREFAERTGTPEGRIQALTWRIDYTNGMWRIASGQRPYAAVFDGIIVLTFLRTVHESHWLPQWGEADRPMIDSLKRLEESIWSLAGEGLSEEQVGHVRKIVDTWLAGDPPSRIVDVAKLPGFGDLAGQGASGSSSVVGELTNMITVDPLSGLEPAVRQIEQTRIFAERAFYYMQHVPELLSARVELLMLRSGQSPDVQGVLASVERVSQAAASIAATAEALPASLSAEREAALSQVSTELTAQREGLVRDLETARAPLSELLTGTRSTVEATKQLSDSLEDTLRVLDAFVGRFVKEEEPGAAPALAATPAGEDTGPPARPFDINEYGAAAERIGVAVRELGNTVTTLDNSLPEVQRVLAEAAAQGERSIDHVFSRAYQLLAAALAGSGLTVLLVRWISLRWRGRGDPPPAG